MRIIIRYWKGIGKEVYLNADEFGGLGEHENDVMMIRLLSLTKIIEL